ncbi:hypothetical protein TSAR_015327 [Trichomalopsis sarcophagae]|uniref:Integrase core domain-containing protein n=1 Tax=Trichomalopsis sarcophagae TaxID=543379 RepID=A0A232EPI7_9HYME|nr:hypothetical protein TSAR_015327 [Trichomalopsis sarcophagae]
MQESNKFIVQKIKKFFKKNYSYKSIIALLKKKFNCNISLRTLSRILKFVNLRRKNIHESPVEKIVVAILLELKGSAYNLGYRSLWLRLKKVYDLNIKQKTVMTLLKVIDPIQKCGFLPTIIRTDHGTEVSIMENLHIALRYHHDDENKGDNSFFKGKSVHNQRIECYWRQYRQHLADYYIHLFKKMEAENLIEINNPVHIDCLRYCFGNLIEQEIELTRKEWNEHRIRMQAGRSVAGGIPNDLYNLPEKFGARDCHQPLNKQHVNILLKKYTENPILYPKRFEDIAKIIGKQSIPSTVSEALYLYVNIIDIIENNV